jgi:8-oxo-dGTP pyrophosphatase MutT (NUDIX family)
MGLNSAVMVLIEHSSKSLILTERSDDLLHHPGEICFPGGKWDKADVTLYQTALRELYEEIGVAADRVQLIQELSVERTLMGSIIHPWLACIKELEPVVINMKEVKSIIRVPLVDVEKKEHYQDILIEKNGLKIRSCQFTASKELIWGATARIMRQLTAYTYSQEYFI